MVAPSEMPGVLPGAEPGPGFTAQAGSEDLLRVTDLSVLGPGGVRFVDTVEFSIGRGETLGLVGESGSGKSLTASSLMRLLSPPLTVAPESRIELSGRNLPDLSDAAMRKVRGGEIGMVFQEPALNPLQRIGAQVAESLLLHQTLSGQALRDRCVELLELVGIPAPERRLRDFPHQLSGGMQQRVMIAMAIACRPRLLIADEPTTALDVTIQAQVLELLEQLAGDHGMSILLISHDLGVIAQSCRRVAIMYSGRIVETGPVGEVFDNPRHPYTQALLRAAPVPGMRSDVPLAAIPGTVPHPGSRPAGCHFAPRCPKRTSLCEERYPEPFVFDGSHRVNCWHAND